MFHRALSVRNMVTDSVCEDAFLSSMSHHQVLCLHACCLSVCFVCTLSKAYLSSDPFETCSRGSLVKNVLRIVNKTIVVFIACVVIPDVPQ